MANNEKKVSNENNATDLIKFKVIEVNEITAKNGNKFLAYKTLGKGGRKLDIRFTRDCQNVPRETCTIVVKRENANVDKSRYYPILWIKNVEKIEQTVRKSNLEEFFGEDEETADEI